MAIFIPSEYNPANPQNSELTVFNALQKRLDDTWTIFHNLSYKNPQTQEDGEIDFLICNHLYGMLVLEVKGGTISCIGGNWYQNGHQIDPFGQAKKNKYAILEKLKQSFGFFGLKVVHAVCFPDCHSNTCWPPEAEGLVITGRQLTKVEERIIQILNNFTIAPHGIVPAMAEIINALTPLLVFGNRLGERISREREYFNRFTEDKSELLEALENFPRLLFRGCAGSGKTMLAVKKAKMLSEQGKKVLLLCYNQLLAKKLQKAVQYYGNITADAFFEYCISKLGLTEEQLAGYRNDPRLYSKLLPKLMADNIPRLALVYDAVIVDEGQDFIKEAWPVIEQLLFEDGIFYIFYDPDQNIFTKGENLPEMPLPPIVLKRNCRNTRNIFQALTRYRTIESTIPDEAPDGCEVRDFTGNVPEMLIAELNRLVDVEQISLSEIVILGAHSLNHTSLAELPAECRFHLRDNCGSSQKMEVPYYTYMKFKGCESSVVIMVDVDESDPRWDRSGLYTAMSRAVHQLIILRPGK